MAEVVLADPAAEGLPAFLAALLEAAILRSSGARLLESLSGTVAVEVPDAEVRVGVVFGGGRATVLATDPPRADLRLRMASNRLLELSSVPLRGGLPDVGTAAGRAVVRDLLTGAIRIRGVRHVRLLRGFTMLLSTAS